MKKINAHIIFIAALFALSLLYLNSILHKGVILDNIHYINDLAFVSYNTKEALKNNELPLWTPYFYSGHPLVAIPENYMFDLNFLFIYLFRDIYLAMNLALVFYFFMAGLGMYFLVHSLAASKKAGFVAAVIYMLNGFMHTFVISGHINILAGYALIPFVFLFAHKALKSREWFFYSLLAGIFFALQIFSGSMIFFFYTALLVFFYFAFSIFSRNFTGAIVKSIFVGLVIAIAALSLASMKLLPVLEFTKMSSRAVNVSFQEFLGYPIDFKDIARIAMTNIGYSGLSAAAGIIGFMLLVYGLSEYKKRIVVFSFAIAIFSLLFASGTLVAGIMHKIPGFDKLRHVERALVLFVFAASILSAYGFIALSGRLKKYSAYAKHESLVFAGIVFLILAELLLVQNVPLPAKIVQPENVELLAYMKSDTSIFRTINLAQKEVIGAAGYNYYSQEGISEVKGGGGIWVNDYVTFVGIAQQALNPKIFGILNVKYIVSDRKLEAGNLTLVDRFKQCKECAVWNAFGPYLYRNELFLPRFYNVPNSILVVGDNAAARQLVYSLMFQNFEPKNAVLIEGTRINDYDTEFLRQFSIIFLVRGSVDQDSFGRLREYVAKGGVIVPDILNGQNTVSSEDISMIFNRTIGNYTEIGIDEYSGNKVVLNLDGEKGWLVASERFAYFPGWKASIEGKNVDILKADNAISAVHLNGEHGKLVFEYKPNSYRMGKVISSSAFILILACFAWIFYRRKTKGKNNLGTS